ncbi:RNA polymerase factor sigma-54 [Lactobacillus sp.]|uniref:RNA polymerase factor sigma-54 n=1 Tax=Lactobacillus sp. TaxID=1591 RepID=UPI0025E8538B|nr:RNA polymerase factor sigma-54 [Lactobacillus sp.]MCO6533961.1 RNA polymerase factor sigma-54 [Lactobacillus sp.]
MTRLQKMVLKPKEQLVTRLFLSPKLKQNLTVLSYSTYDLVAAMKDLSESDPFVSLGKSQEESHNLEWLKDSESESLLDHLLAQVRLSDWNNKVKKAVKLLIYHLADDGYLRTDLAEIAQGAEFSIVELQKAKEFLQTLDPCGIGAKDLNECLLIQAKQKRDFDQVALQILLADDLEMLADPQKWGLTQFSEKQLENALACIQTLDPAPASEYTTGTNTQYLLPDLIFKVEDQRLTIETFQAQIPELLFDEQTFQELKGQAKERQYFTEQKQRYLELKSAIEQRQQTILRLGKYVGEYQHDFLITLQREKLKPLGLKETAKALDLAPSTISRAIKDKYIQCQNKIFSLKMLFPRQVAQDLSQERIEYDLQEMVKAENSLEPLSDQQLVAIFAKHGVELSRRVIAKYRKKLGIPNSYHRKRN